MPDTYLDNPAGRLVELFEAAKKRPADEAAVNGWAEVFGYSRDDQTTGQLAHLVLRDGTKVMDQVADVRRTIEELVDHDPDIYLEHYGEVEGTSIGFANVLSQNMEGFLRPYTPTARQCLRLCSSLLHKYMPEPVIAPDQRQDLLKTLQDLQEEIDADADLPDDVKSFVGARLQEVFDAIYLYKRTGGLPVERATSGLVGSMVTQPEIWGRLSNKWVKRIAAVAAAVTWSLNTANQVQELMPGPEPKPDPTPIVQVYCLTTGTQPGDIEAADDGDVHDAEIVEAQPTG